MKRRAARTCRCWPGGSRTWPPGRSAASRDAAPTGWLVAGWLGAELGEVAPGDVVAVWGAGAVGQLTAGAALVRGAARVMVVDGRDDRLRMVERHVGAEPLNYRYVDVLAELRERSGGRGPDVCVEAVRKGGTVVVLGTWTGPVDTFPLGAVMNKGLTVRSARQHGQRWIPMLLDRMARDELRTEHLATHRLPLERGPDGYALFRERADGCVRAVFAP
jgi:threonine dehydrogenase-like Zn-dependent dehydrogenase